jgi:2'-5' RNA ligase
VVPIDPVSAVVIRVNLPRRLDEIRRLHDPAATLGVPAHVTLLYPFLPVAELRPSVRRALVDIARNEGPFEVEFAQIGRFPGTVYLTPDPPGPYARLTTAIASRFPEQPPYGGAFDEVIPHLTLAQTESSSDEIERDAARFLPFAWRVTAMEVLAEDGAGRWHAKWRIQLGVRP